MEIQNLLLDLTYGEEKPAVKVLIDNDFTKEIRIVFKKGQFMKQHQTKFPIMVEVFQGCIDFGVENERHQLKQGALIFLDASVPHDLIASEDSIIRLSLNKADTIQRVQEVLVD